MTPGDRKRVFLELCKEHGIEPIPIPGTGRMRFRGPVEKMVLVVREMQARTDMTVDNNIAKILKENTH